MAQKQHISQFTFVSVPIDFSVGTKLRPLHIVASSHAIVMNNLGAQEVRDHLTNFSVKGERRSHGRASNRSPCHLATSEMSSSFKGTPLPTCHLVHHSFPRQRHDRWRASRTGPPASSLSSFTGIRNSMVEKRRARDRLQRDHDIRAGVLSPSLLIITIVVEIGIGKGK